MNRSIFRQTKNGNLDRQYLRVCAVYRLLANGRITSKRRAVDLLNARSVHAARQTVELWLAFPLKNHGITA